MSVASPCFELQRRTARLHKRLSRVTRQSGTRARSGGTRVASRRIVTDPSLLGPGRPNECKLPATYIIRITLWHSVFTTTYRKTCRAYQWSRCRSFSCHPQPASSQLAAIRTHCCYLRAVRTVWVFWHRKSRVHGLKDWFFWM